jgi:hypothetical protein
VVMVDWMLEGGNIGDRFHSPLGRVGLEGPERAIRFAFRYVHVHLSQNSPICAAPASDGGLPLAVAFLYPVLPANKTFTHGDGYRANRIVPVSRHDFSFSSKASP